MRGIFDEFIDTLVYCVASIIFGATQATNPVYQNVVREALNGCGLIEAIHALENNISDASHSSSGLVALSTTSESSNDYRW